MIKKWKATMTCTSFKELFYDNLSKTGNFNAAYEAAEDEHESGILRNGLDEFIEWDYVGAPWWFQKYGGNGGFSWRSVKAMKDICKAYSYTGKGQEDTYFCNVMNQSKYFRLAPRKVCERFSVETVYKLGSFGYHFGKDAKLMLRPWEMDKILQQYD